MSIPSFRGDLFFLSNFYECPIEIEGLVFHSAEAAYQSFKDLSHQKDFLNLSALESKKLGRKMILREDWDRVKIEIMDAIVSAKFFQNKDLARKLINVDDSNLVEENNWGDTFWGVCNGIGQNWLGTILKQIKYELLHQYDEEDSFF